MLSWDDYNTEEAAPASSPAAASTTAAPEPAPAQAAPAAAPARQPEPAAASIANAGDAVAKANATAAQPETRVGDDEDPGRQRLQELGLLHLVDSDDAGDDERDAPPQDDAEPSEDETPDDATGDA